MSGASDTESSYLPQLIGTTSAAGGSLHAIQSDNGVNDCSSSELDARPR
jgi:hypothetical protein